MAVYVCMCVTCIHIYVRVVVYVYALCMCMCVCEYVWCVGCVWGEALLVDTAGLELMERPLGQARLKCKGPMLL